MQLKNYADLKYNVIDTLNCLVFLLVAWWELGGWFLSVFISYHIYVMPGPMMTVFVRLLHSYCVFLLIATHPGITVYTLNDTRQTKIPRCRVYRRTYIAQLNCMIGADSHSF